MNGNPRLIFHELGKIYIIENFYEIKHCISDDIDHPKNNVGEF